MQGNILSIDSDRVAKASPWPHKRLTHYLSRVHMYNSPYGLMKSEVLSKTHLEKSFPGSDHVLMAELAMLGIFVEIPEPLLRIRKHPGRSFTANRTSSALRELFNPGNSKKGLHLDMWSNLHLEVIKSAMIIPPAIRDKVLCTLISLMVPLYWRLRGFGGRQKRKLLERVSKKRQK